MTFTVRNLCGTRDLGLKQKLIAPRSPWQNPFVQRLVGSIRRECLNYVLVLHEQPLRRRLRDYLSYYHQHSTHRSLDEDSPESRAIEPPDEGNIIGLPLVRGLHHRYARKAAARGAIFFTPFGSVRGVP
jgi:putative transposase